MKTVTMFRDYRYRPHAKVTILFRGGLTYRRVLETAAHAIEHSGAGRIVHDGSPHDPPGSLDAFPAWQRNREKWARVISAIA